MKAPSRHENGKRTGSAGRLDRPPRTQGERKLLPALIALGGGSLLVAGPAAALQLGELRVQSSLGQPLRASIAYALNPDERIASHCIRLGGGRTASGLPAVSNARIAVSENAILITGRAPLNEPLLALTLNVDCPNTAKLVRDYTAFVDPATTGQPEEAVAATRAAPAPDVRDVRGPVPNRAPASAAAPAEPVRAGTYRVQAGDSLSAIASRIAGRGMGLWDTVEALYAANPHAFIDGNRDLLRAGSELAIPAAVLERGAGAATRAAITARPAAAPREAAPSSAPQETATVAPAAAANSVTAVEATPATADPAASVPAAETPRAEPRQGDVALGADGPFVAPIPSDAGANAAASAEPAAAPARPSASRPAFNPRPDDGSSRTWLMWLGGTGAALILALVLFGRRLKQRFGAGAASLDDATSLNSDDTTIVARADLEGSPDEATDDAAVDLAEEFGYTMSGELSGRSEDSFGSTAILESEILPSDETGEYDLSMIVDATRQALPDAEDTTKDLRAIQLDENGNEDEDSGEYTLSQESDYRILEQDYQDELTATQALDAELTRAASEMTLEIGTDDAGSLRPQEAQDDDATSLLPQEADGDTAADDATSLLPWEEDDAASLPPPETDGEDAAGGAAAAMPDPDNASASTIEMRPTGETSAAAESPAEDDREDTRADEDLTATLADAENDPTAETGETKKLRA